MKNSRHTLACAALVAAFAGPALAQTPAPAASPAPQAPRAGHEHDHGRKDASRREQRFDQRMAELKSQLQLRDEQEGAWTQFVQAMRPAVPPQRPDREAIMKLPTPERIDQMRAMRQQQMARMDQRADATKAFYASLTPEQKKRFDERTARMMDREGPARHGHHGHHG